MLHIGDNIYMTDLNSRKMAKKKELTKTVDIIINKSVFNIKLNAVLNHLNTNFTCNAMKHLGSHFTKVHKHKRSPLQRNVFKVEMILLVNCITK